MNERATTGHAQTVRGAVAAEDLGPTLMHEHLLIDLRPIFKEPTDPEERAIAHAPMTLDNLAWVYRNFCSSLDNLVLDDPDLAVREALAFRKAGGCTIVDVGSVGIRPDPLLLRQIAERTGLHVVMGCSHYHARFHPPDMDARSEEAICDEIVRDLTEGVDGTGIKAGIIGEVGCSSPMFPNEAKVLRASARAQRRTGAAITLHPGPAEVSPFEILDILEAAGADPGRVIMGHVERAALPPDRLLALARRGCYLEYDWFGEVRAHYPYGRVDVPSDGERIKAIAGLIGQGFGAQILVAHDVCFKTRLAAYGGPGYAHINKNVAEWMKVMGIGAGAIDDILVRNPARALAYA